MQHEQIVPTTEEGDQRFTFAVDNEAEVAAAMERFDDLVNNQKRFAVALGDNGDGSTLLRKFDPTAKRTIFMPQRKGG